MISFPELQIKQAYPASTLPVPEKIQTPESESPKSSFQEVLVQVTKEPENPYKPVNNQPEVAKSSTTAEKSEVTEEAEVESKLPDQDADELVENGEEEEESKIHVNIPGILDKVALTQENRESIEDEPEIHSESTEIPVELFASMNAELPKSEIENRENTEKTSLELTPKQNSEKSEIHTELRESIEKTSFRENQPSLNKKLVPNTKKEDNSEKVFSDKKQSIESLLVNEFKSLENSENLLGKLDLKTKESRSTSNKNSFQSEKPQNNLVSNSKESSDEKTFVRAFVSEGSKNQKETRDQIQTEKNRRIETILTKDSSPELVKSSETTGFSNTNSNKNEDSNFLNVFQKENGRVNNKENVQQNSSLASSRDANFQKNLQEIVKSAQFHIIENGKNSARIELNPKDLGKLTLQITQDKERVEGQILVENQEAKSYLESEMDTLKTELKTIGLNLESLSIEVNLDGSPRKFFDWEKQGAENTGSREARGSKNQSESDSDSGEEVYQKDPRKLVDIRIY